MRLRLLGDVLHNMFTGYYEKPKPSTQESADIRKQNCLDCINRLLPALVGPGDLLSSDVRADFALEAYNAWGRKLEDGWSSESPFRDLAHVIVNQQQKLDEAFFDSFVDRLKKFCAESAKGPALELDDYKAMAVELNTVASLCVGVRAFCAAAGLEAPAFPAKPSPCQLAHFQRVSDYSTKSLTTNKSVAWVPILPLSNLRREVTDRFGIDRSKWSVAGNNPEGPSSKATAAPLTCWEFLKFMEVMYIPVSDMPRFMKVPGEDRTLNRGQLEIAAAEYTTAKSCKF
eukprot:TRINITY_DN20129_c0_g3_i1.p1 TRINITY_DN20129_c0_g3~~TRINITY_DN20129_c0_g3_i1.p1  ORF type:complete len:286 (-),score=43.90 TRINITY_DN20129_c0_g3_i1:560-1417(-)